MQIIDFFFYGGSYKEMLPGSLLKLDLSRVQTNFQTIETNGEDSPILNKVLPTEIAGDEINFRKGQIARFLDINGADDESQSHLFSPNQQLKFNSYQNSEVYNILNIASSQIMESLQTSMLSGAYPRSFLVRDEETSSNIYKSAISEEFGGNLSYFTPLYDLLCKLFCRIPTTAQEFKLDEHQVQIAKTIIIKKNQPPKKYKKRPNDVKQRAVSLEELSKVLLQPKNKRAEECYKFLMSKIFKFLKSRFGKTGVDHSEDAFYQLYFGQTAKELGIPIERFYYPGNSPGLIPRNIKIEFLDVVFKSQPFSQAFADYIANHLWKNYRMKIWKKFERLLGSWEKKIQENPDKKAAIVADMIKEISRQKKSKLPWTTYEVAYAVDKLQSRVAQFQKVASITEQ